MTTTLTAPARTLGRTGRDVSPLGYGSVPIGRAGYPLEQARRLLHGLLDAGVTLIDTAAAYGDAEEVIGRVLAERRDDYTLVTKAGMVAGYAPAWSGAEITRTIEQSLRRLRTDAVDVVLLHSCDRETLEEGEAVEAVLAAREAGRTRWIGYSGDGEALEHAVGLGVFDCVEASYSLLDQANRATIERAAAAGLGVLLKRPLANRVPGRTSPPDDEYAAEYWPRWEALRLTPKDVGGVPWAEASLRFAAFAEGVTCALVGSGSLAHMESNVAAVNAGPLPPDVVAHLEVLFDAHGATWPGLT
jgi:aryl-alcohol dehydrogenase-like predicted oxidoreductase